MNFKEFSLKLCFLTLIFSTASSWGWGERGHHVICEVATRLVVNQNLKNFLSSRGHMMGHLCNVPDTWWRSAGPEAKVGDAGHYINPDKLGLKIQEVPLQYSQLFEMKFATPEGSKGADAINLPEFLGTLWWRGDQFYRLAIRAASNLQSAPLPTREQQQDWNFLYNKYVFEMIETMGVMGHFIGDASMPYHSDGDYDGWASGHGGIHSYYESFSVDQMALDLPSKVFNLAQAEKSFDRISGDTSLAVLILQKLSSISHLEKIQIEKLDPIKKVTALGVTADAGVKSGLKVAPAREDAKVGAKKFQTLILKELARSAKALAVLWDSIYERGLKPDLSAYRSYRYPLKPDFIRPDYLPPAPAN